MLRRRCAGIWDGRQQQERRCRAKQLRGEQPGTPPPWSVAVLEAKRVAWNASGRNAGFVAPGFSERLETFVERVGLRRAKELWALSSAGVDYVRTTIRETEMPGVEPVYGRLTVRRTDDEEAVLRLVAMLRVDFGVEAEPWPTQQ